MAAMVLRMHCYKLTAQMPYIRCNSFRIVAEMGDQLDQFGSQFIPRGRQRTIQILMLIGLSRGTYRKGGIHDANHSDSPRQPCASSEATPALPSQSAVFLTTAAQGACARSASCAQR